MEAIPGLIHKEFEATRADMRNVVRDIGGTVDRNISTATTALNETINRQGDAARGTLDAQLTSVVARVDSQLTATNTAVAEFATVAGAARAAIAKIDSALPFYTDCDAGMCLANVIYGIGRETERTMRSVDKTMGVIAAKSPPVADSIEKSAAAVEQRSRQSVFRNLFFSLKPDHK
jgi:hypothetical protein